MYVPFGCHLVSSQGSWISFFDNFTRSNACSAELLYSCCPSYNRSPDAVVSSLKTGPASTAGVELTLGTVYTRDLITTQTTTTPTSVDAGLATAPASTYASGAGGCSCANFVVQFPFHHSQFQIHAKLKQISSSLNFYVLANRRKLL